MSVLEKKDGEFPHDLTMNQQTVSMSNIARKGNSKLMCLMLLWIVRLICEIARRFDKAKQGNDMFSFLWNFSEVFNTGGERAERTIEICCKDLSHFYPCDLNEKELQEEMRLVDRLTKSDILDEKLTIFLVP